MLQSNFVIKAPYPEKDLKEHANKTTMYSQTYRHTTDDISVKADHRFAPKFETHFSLGSETDRKTSEAKANFHHNRSLTRQYDRDSLQKKNSQTQFALGSFKDTFNRDGNQDKKSVRKNKNLTQ